MKGRINLASAARKASAKGRLSRARVGARSMGGEGGGERREGGEGTARKGTRKHNRHADTTTQNNTDFEAACMHGRGRRRTFVGRSPVGGLEEYLQNGRPLYKGNRRQ